MTAPSVQPASASTSPAPLPGPLEPTATAHFASADGTRLYGEWFAPTGKPRAAALIVHGYAEHCGRYREVANVLVGAGIAAFSYDMRGHGRAEGQRGHILAIEQYLDDLDAALAELETRLLPLGGEAIPLFIVAHSNGALISLRALTDPARAPRRARAIVISSPFLGLRLEVPRLKKALGRVAARIAPTLSLANDLRVEHLTSDLQKQAERRVDTLCHAVAGARWFVATERAQQHVLASATRVRIPSLWLVGADDPIANPAVAQLVHGRLGTPGEWHLLAGYKHEVFNERERGHAFALIRDFFARQLAV
jgi:lysophospholipase